MQFDRTLIVTRERDYLDILDLALCVVRRFAGPLSLSLAAGVAPFVVLNAWLLAGYSDQDFELGYPPIYLLLMTLLVLYEIPLATAPATIFLGEAVFAERPGPSQIARTFWRGLPQMFLFQGLLRWWFWTWPYFSEVILLEQNPLRAKDSRQLSTLQRSKSLHGGNAGDLFSRIFFALGLGSLLFLSIWVSMLIVFNSLLGEWEWGNPQFLWLYPLALWLVVGFFAVVRFLSYLDLRIRREGWEVELLMRAEQTRLTRNLT